MKNKSVALPQEDQQRVLALCANHTYDEVLEIIARPRPEGLQLKTSYSALCRFNCSHTPEDIARLDYRIASEGRASAEKWAHILGYPGALVKDLNSSKASAKLATKVLQDSKSSVAKSTSGTGKIHLNPPKTPVNPHNPLKST